MATRFFPASPGACGRDPLTGLATAEAALAAIAHWHAAARDGRVMVHAMLVSLASFSAVNLAHGRVGGDEALVETAERMRHFARGELGARWVLARMTGDSFLVAMDEPISRERWQWLAEELGRWITRPIGCTGEADTPAVRLRPRLTLSRSVPGETPERMLARLFESLDHHRAGPLRCPAWVDGTISPALRGGPRLEADLAAALADGGIEVVYQPQFACEDGRITGAEALARWQHPLLGPIGPDTLFAIAERAGKSAQLSRCLMLAALAGARDWPAPLKLSLNVTAADLFGQTYEPQVLGAIADTGFPAHRLVLEITESAPVSDLARTAEALGRLQAAGVDIALDDFGAGFCNFRYLKLLPLAELKLDRSMVEGIAEDPRDLAVLRGIIAMARALDLAVTAEGIETPAQRDLVAAEGCTRWQGFLGSRPLSGDEFTRMVRGEPRAV